MWLREWMGEDAGGDWGRRGKEGFVIILWLRVLVVVVFVGVEYTVQLFFCSHNSTDKM